MDGMQQLDFFGDQKAFPKRKRVKPIKSKKVNKNNSDQEFVVTYDIDTAQYTDEAALLTPEYSAQGISITWRDEHVVAIFEGLIYENLKKLRQTKPGSKARDEILSWLNSDEYKGVCEGLGLDSASIADGVFVAVGNYDFDKCAEKIITAFLKFDEKKLEKAIETSGLSVRDVRSRRFIATLAKALYDKLSGSWSRFKNFKKEPKFFVLCEKLGIDQAILINKMADIFENSNDLNF